MGKGREGGDRINCSNEFGFARKQLEPALLSLPTRDFYDPISRLRKHSFSVWLHFSCLCARDAAFKFSLGATISLSLSLSSFSYYITPFSSLILSESAISVGPTVGRSVSDPLKPPLLLLLLLLGFLICSRRANIWWHAWSTTAMYHVRYKSNAYSMITFNACTRSKILYGEQSTYGAPGSLSVRLADIINYHFSMTWEELETTAGRDVGACKLGRKIELPTVHF